MGPCLSKQENKCAPVVVVVQARATNSRVKQEICEIKRFAPTFRVVKCHTWHQAKSMLRSELTVHAQTSNGDVSEHRKMVVLHVVGQPTGILRKIAHCCGMCCCAFTRRRKYAGKTCAITVRKDEGVQNLDAFIEHIKKKVAAKGTAIALEAYSGASVVKHVLKLPDTDSTLHAENFYADVHRALSMPRADVHSVGMKPGDNEFTSDYSNDTERAEESTASRDETRSETSRSETNQLGPLQNRVADRTLTTEGMGLPLDRLASIGAAKKRRLNGEGFQTIEDLADFDVTNKMLCMRVTGNKRQDRAVETVKKWKESAQTYLDNEELRVLEMVHG